MCVTSLGWSIISWLSNGLYIDDIVVKAPLIMKSFESNTKIESVKVMRLFINKHNECHVDYVW